MNERGPGSHPRRLRLGVLAATLAVGALGAAPSGGGTAESSATCALWGELEPGPFVPGYAVRPRFDASRPLSDGRPRPVLVSVWYPARPAADGPPTLRYGDYVGLSGRALAAGDDATAAAAAETKRVRDALVQQAHLSDEAADRWLEAPLLGRLEAPAADGEFALVLLAQGNGNAPDRQALLSEYLASHGFVVLTVPSPARISGPPRSEADVRPKAEEQADDLAWLQAHAAELSPAKLGAGVALVGYSFGARAVLVDALRRHAAQAIVSLDGGIGNAQGRDYLDGAAYFDPARVAVPLLHLYQAGDEVVKPDFALIEKLARSDRLLVELASLRHGHFTMSAMLRRLGPGYEALVPPELDPEPASEAAHRWTLAFLRAHLLGETGELEGLVEAGPGGPVLSVRRLPGRPKHAGPET